MAAGGKRRLLPALAVNNDLPVPEPATHDRLAARRLNTGAPLRCRLPNFAPRILGAGILALGASCPGDVAQAWPGRIRLSSPVLRDRPGSKMAAFPPPCVKISPLDADWPYAGRNVAGQIVTGLVAARQVCDPARDLARKCGRGPCPAMLDPWPAQR